MTERSERTTGPGDLRPDDLGPGETRSSDTRFGETGVDEVRSGDVPSSGRAAARGRGGPGRRVSAVPYVFLAPAMALFVLFLALPIGYTIYLSLRRTKVSGLGLGRGARKEIFVGLRNYGSAVGDGELWAGWLRVLGYGALVLAVMLGLALVFALMLDSAHVRLARFSRISIFLPYAVPGVAATLLWGFLYLPSLSPVNALLSATGGEVNLLGAGTVVYSMANVAVWGGVGFNMLVLYTTLRAVPRDYYEAARIDGAGELQIALRVKIPILTPAIILTTVFSVIATIQVFTEPTTLRPLTNTISSTWSPLMKVYRDAFVTGDLYSAAATSIVVAAIALVLSFGFLRVVKSRAFGEG
jgi:multiple sugar transport system permease protein